MSEHLYLLTNGIDWDLRKPCNDCPFRRDAPQHFGVAKSLGEYLTSIDEGRFAHTCHKTDNRLECDGPRNYQGERPKHCAGAIHFLIRSGLDLQLPLLEATEAGKLDYKQAQADAAHSNVFESPREMIRYYLPILRKTIEERQRDPKVCVVFPEQPDDPPTMLPLSVARDQGLDILPCLKCDEPATSYDRYWPHHMSHNFCDQHGDNEGPTMASLLAELLELVSQEETEAAEGVKNA